MKSFLKKSILIFLFLPSISDVSGQVSPLSSYQDTAFWQEFHEAYPVRPSASAPNEVRSIAVDKNANVWIATAAGVFVKKANHSAWTALPTEGPHGPAFSVAVDAENVAWVGTWEGVYRSRNQKLERLSGVEAPISALCPTQDGLVAIGPKGIWQFDGQRFVKKDWEVPRSVRHAMTDTQGNLWLASDVGLYNINKVEKTRILRNKNELLSAYIKGSASDTQQQIWAGGLGGVTVLQEGKKIRTITPAEGLPTVYVTCVKAAPDGTMWVGTEKGVVRYYPNGTHSLRFTRRWLLDDHVVDIDFDQNGNAWIATKKGVSVIKRQQMTLAQKNDYFHDVLLKRHIRAPWIAGQCRLEKAGDLTTWQPEDDDNDGEYTGNYLAMECFRYAVTKSPDAKENAKKAFGFLKLLQEVTDTEGFFARTIVPVDWKGVLHDKNRSFSPQELADELVKEPRFKPVEVRWRKSKDGKWLWKGDTSSDEMCGHMFGYYFYYELVADDTEKALVRKHVARIVDYLIKHNYNFVDIDGKPTRWSVWSPDQLNRDPEWAPDKNQNSMELLGFLKLAHYMTNDDKYQREYLRLIEKEHYLENMAQVIHQNPAWFIYFDVVLQAYIYPILLKCEKDPQRLAFYQKHMDEWFEKRKADQNPLINFIYCYSRNEKVELANSVDFLVDTPLDLIDWPIDHTQREDLKIVRTPVLEDQQVNILQPASIRMTVRWDKNPWTAAGGDAHIEREPVFWQLPYWMGRYLGMIR
ncbi:regulator [Runella rosea]|uniref:Regulator n=1 Tax=Runella rosea TaxID=2259595 RepID=A0A344TIJ5_9BACT|nr:two-component regulator propeller domain-containing protein [Runella rosea]AXE18466.1 regulator [Runella rosea]